MDNPIREEQLYEDRKQNICIDILTDCRNELYMNMRFLDVSLSGLRFVRHDTIHFLGTDGVNLYYQPEQLMRAYASGKNIVNRGYFHTLLHCLFCHGFPERSNRGGIIKRDETYWNLACDMAVEFIMDDLVLRCIHLPKSPIRRQAEKRFREQKNSKALTAQKLYRTLCELRLPESEIAMYQREFGIDDHQFWYKERPGQPNNSRKRENWDDTREKMQTEMELFSKEAGQSQNTMSEQLQIANRKRYDYREFLRKFAIPKEVMQVDMDTFDYIFYHYGMQKYGNMPLIEPLETKEVNQIQDFVIVIDTSMSCEGELVKKFLEHTYEILREAESFSHRFHVHIIQCDDKIRHDQKITDREQMKHYMEHFEVLGQGGTDFRPPFTYVEELKSKGEFLKLKGLLYFTDGYGVFPLKKPDYDVAFIFMKEDYQDVDVPPWALKLIIEPDELDTEID
ncbi:MAG: VWA-like domain-containing protein [Eubacteriales bacterium]|nr:VWA-like domain-containing protein [Eubacteriales bacterium]